MSKKEYLGRNDSKDGVRNNNKIVRGEVIYVDLGGARGSEQGKIRPCLVIQNNIGNKFSPTLIVAPIGHKKVERQKKIPTQVEILSKHLVFGKVDGLVLCEQIRTVDRVRVSETNIAKFNEKAMLEVNKALAISMGM